MTENHCSCEKDKETAVFGGSDCLSIVCGSEASALRAACCVLQTVELVEQQCQQPKPQMSEKGGGNRFYAAVGTDTKGQQKPNHQPQTSSPGNEPLGFEIETNKQTNDSTQTPAHQQCFCCSVGLKTQ